VGRTHEGIHAELSSFQLLAPSFQTGYTEYGRKGDLAFANIKKAARHYGVDVEEDDWCQLGKHPHIRNTAHEG
jgi:hypothetical protein